MMAESTSNLRAPLRLTAMTLRGVGSYLQGARLEIRPMTILCGKNGSGKSTWFKVLHMLRESLKTSGPLEFLDTMEYRETGTEYTNAWLHYELNRRTAATAEGLEVDEEYGPIGTTGLEMIAEATLTLEPNNTGPGLSASLAAQFLWEGRLNLGTRLRVRMAHPRLWVESERKPEDQYSLPDVVELRMDGQHAICWTRQDKHSQYAVECSG